MRTRGAHLRKSRRDDVSKQVGVPTFFALSQNQIVVLDSFDRADNALSMGNADTGQTWVPNSGTWGIISNQAYQPVLGGQTTTIVETGLANCTIEATVSNAVPANLGETSLCFRSVDDLNNFIGNRSSLFVRVAGSFTNLGAWTYGNNDRIKVELYGPYIRCFTNNILRLSITNTNHQTATKHGIRIQFSTSDRVDDFRVTL